VTDQPGVHLLRTDDREAEVEAFVAHVGRRVGLGGVLRDLNRDARAVTVPARAVSWGFRWDHDDHRDQRWWPQGITTSADAGDPEDLDGRTVLLTSWYAREVDGVAMGSRLTVVDLTDRARIRYRHVLLVTPVLSGGRLDVRPVTVHAGGIVWHGEHVHVAGTARGLSSFRLDDIVRSDGFDMFGYRYLLPVRFTYDAQAASREERLRYSFASVDRSSTPHALVVGEYGRNAMSTRLARFEIDPVTSALAVDDDGMSRPRLLERGVAGMQGATVVDGAWYVTTSRGRFRRGSVWVGRPGDLTEHRAQLPIGPEDVAYWPSRDELWSLSEYPHVRYVFGMPRTRFAG
jgi:hypothetical protein